MKILKLTIPLVAPSVNHYKKHDSRSGRWFLTPESLAFLDAIAIFSRGAVVEGKKFSLTYTVFLGKGKSGDVDNFAKCILDGIARAGVIRSDASIDEMHAYKKRDRENPRTEITVEAISE